MSYGFDLVRLSAGVDRNADYQRLQGEHSKQVSSGSGDPGPIDPLKEEWKQRLAAALTKRHPSLEIFKRDYSRIASARSIAESEARRLFRNIELNEKQLSFQILLFDDAAGANYSFVGDPRPCADALHALWDCLQVLESEGGLSTYDPQIGKVLDLKHDFDLVRDSVCGRA
jgi:alkanesulfonate monooxygenase SsuD/methylene tetrahydromethanopterin reductase-like flavin-dependent oxidoreductase (luciferase family)